MCFNRENGFLLKTNLIHKINDKNVCIERPNYIHYLIKHSREYCKYFSKQIKKYFDVTCLLLSLIIKIKNLNSDINHFIIYF